ncbi:MAG TPA: S8 family serine peptidase [Thermoanaerobaculia bacterium]|nr:S8 family serine peptidase [Thermoanaerobaculia bacterium]
MNRKYLLWIAPWIAFGLGACATVQRTETSKACAEWRWIGVRSPQETECPAIPGWEKPVPLFASVAAARAQAGLCGYDYEERIPEPALEALEHLERFCVYETGKKLRNVPFPPTTTGELVRIDQDCAAISIAGGTAWQTHSENFLAQAGKPAEPLAIKNQGGVRLAFLDTHPTGEGVPAALPKGKPISEHGYTLTQIARNLICSPEDSDRCAALITTRLALPIKKFDAKSRKRTKIDTEQGGHIGTQGDLAQAILDEVDDWRGDLRKRDAPQHLVINLSVAWDGERFGGLDAEEIEEMSTGTQAVYWALRYARGFDVLVLAAAGNAQACEPPSGGPLLPAAWEEAAPWEEACGELPPGTPLLYAVGGVDTEGKPLANARRRGMAERAAYGAFAVVPDLAPGRSTNMYTGTSISTAVASSIAAIVWDTLPDRRPGEIMRLLDGSGDNLSDFHPFVPANFWFGARAAIRRAEPPVRRLSLCAALKAACEAPGGSAGCPLRRLWCEPWRPVEQSPSILPRLSSCHPWVHTQPPEEPCPVCEPPRLKN